jgi:hypothetical protein
MLGDQTTGGSRYSDDRFSDTCYSDIRYSDSLQCLQSWISTSFENLFVTGKNQINDQPLIYSLLYMEYFFHEKDGCFPSFITSFHNIKMLHIRVIILIITILLLLDPASEESGLPLAPPEITI